MDTELHVTPLDDGRYALHATGGEAADRVLGEFGTREEAEHALLVCAEQAEPDAAILLPGTGQGVR